MEIGERIKYCRQNLKMSREELAEKLGLSKHAIAKYEQGQRTPDGKMLIQISDALGLELTYFLETKYIRSDRIINLIKKKNITIEDFSNQLNLSKDIIDNFMNNCEIKTKLEQDVLENICDYFDVSNSYLIGDSDYKCYEDDTFSDLERLLEHVKVTEYDQTRYFFNNIIDLVHLTLSEAISSNKKQELQYILNLYNSIYDLIRPLRSNAYSIFCPNTPYSEKPLKKEEIDNLINTVKQDLCEEIDKMANYYQDIDTWNKDTHYENLEIENILNNNINQKD